MKPKMLIVMLFVGLISQQWAVSQTDTNSVATNEPAISTAPTSQPATTVAAPEATGTSTNESSDATSSNTPVIIAITAEISNETASATTTMSTNVLPVQFQDVPLTTAIENLARLAGINYLLDPQIGYGQPDQNGKIKPEPTISVRWENITALQALLAVLDNYGLQLVEDPKTKIARITIQNPSAPPPLITRVIQLKYAGASNMVSAVEGSLTDKRSKAMPDSRTSQLIVVATENEQNAVNTLVEQLDKPTRQVLIETKLVEISSKPSTSKGIDWSGTLATQNISVGNDALPGIPPQAAIPANPALGTTAVPANAGTIGGILSAPALIGSLNRGSFFNPSQAFLNADGVKAVFSFLNSDSDVQVVSTPRLVTMDNETANIAVTEAIPIFNITASTANTSGGSSVTYSNVGTILQVTPRISANDYIWLKVVPEVSSTPGSSSQNVGGSTYSAPLFDYRRIETQVLIPNADTLVMGGLVRDNPTAAYTKVPILGDIPILGQAFRSESKSLDKDNLIIFITPTIVRDSDFQSPPPTKFFKSRPMTIKPPMNPKSVWDNAEPYHNWSDPVPKESSNP
jgi:type II secretory pathway component GspD/PulD (secretin)